MLGTLVLGFRRAAGLTQHEMARRAGLSLGSIRDLEQGRTHRPMPGSMAALVTALGLTPAQAGELERAAAGRGLQLQILGPLAVWRDGAAVRPSGPTQRTVLGLLALSPGSVVHRSEIIDALWVDSPPANAVNLVQVHVSRLRKVLAHRHPDGGDVLGTVNGGYRLQAGPAELDSLKFSHLIAEARLARSNNDHEAACSLYQAALGLWRGDPLADLDLLRGHPAVAGLTMQRAEAVVEYARTASAVGWHDRVLLLLRELAGREPLNEPAHAQLMIALAGCGQQAEALAVYHALRDRLDNELGMPPGQDLAEAHHLILRQDIRAPRALATVASSAGATRTAAELGITAMERSLTAARDAAREDDWQRAALHATAALDLRRGAPPSGVAVPPSGELEFQRLAELRLEAQELRIAAELNLGRHAEVVAELSRLIDASPLREHLHGLLMLALYRCGRRAEALEAYQRARDKLLEELGSEPGPELRDLRRQILSDGPALATPQQVSEQGAPGHQNVPRELPGAVRPFAGRVRELRVLTGLLNSAQDDGPGTVVISAISGTAGVGKTALAVRWAHEVADRFPDGHLYVDLRGYGPDQPMRAGQVLGGFLRSLGMPGEDIPLIDSERAARYRSLLADRRMLILLDNVREVEQVRPLLPGTPGCFTVVTSRDALAGLVARDGATRLELDTLPLADAVGLLRNLLGDRVDEDPGATETLAQACCRLPLVLRVAAELIVKRPDAALADVVAELSDHRRRLELLDAHGDPRTMMRAVFSWSYRYLPENAARAFRLAGLHPGPHLDRYTVGALVSVSAEEADAMIRVLASAHLIQPVGANRYIAHDLLRAYARELATDHDGEAECAAALTRLLDFYLHTAASAMSTLYPGEHDLPPASLVGAQSSRAPFDDGADALAWLDAERNALLVVAAYMAGSGWPGHAVRLSGILWRYFDSGGHLSEAVAIHGDALRAARDTGNRAAEATALMRLGVIDYRKGRYEQATDRLQQALPLFSSTGDQASEARTMCNLGLIDLQQDRHDQAADRLQQALMLFREVGDQASEARMMCNLGLIDLQQGRHDQAADRLEQALAWLRKMGNRVTGAYALVILGNLDLRQGRYQQAEARLREGLAVWRETGYRSGEADVLRLLGALEGRRGRYSRADDRLQEALAVCVEIGQQSVTGNVLADLGLIEQAQGRYEQATGHLQQALGLFREIGDLGGQCTALNHLGAVLLGTGHPDQAGNMHADALRLATQVGLCYEKACAHDGLGGTYDALGNASCARSHWQEALGLYTELGVPEAEQVRARLGFKSLAAHGLDDSSSGD